MPNPLNFCLHKLIIAQRRNKAEKKQKDIEQAIYTLSAIKIDDFSKSFHSLPKKWKGMILSSFKQSLELMPLERELIEDVLKESKINL